MIREQTKNEKLYVGLHTNSNQMAIQFVLEGKGFISERDLKEAVEAANKSCPGMCFCLKKGKWKEIESPTKICFHKEIVFNQDKIHECDLVTSPMNIEEYCSEIHYCKKQTRLIIRVFHAVADGQGVLLWIKNIFRALRNEPLIQADFMTTDESFLKSHGTDAKLGRLKFQIPSNAKYMSFSNGTFYWNKITLSENPGAVVPKIAFFLTQIGLSKKNVFMLPVDLRRHSRNFYSTSNLTLPVFLETLKEDSFELVFTKYLKLLKHKLELSKNNPTIPSFLIRNPFVLSKLLKLAKAYQNIQKKFLVGGIISHLGKYNLNEICTNDIEIKNMYVLPPIHPFAPININIIGNQIHTEIIISGFSEYLPAAYCDDLLKNLETFLKEKL